MRYFRFDCDSKYYKIYKIADGLYQSNFVIEVLVAGSNQVGLYQSTACNQSAQDTNLAIYHDTAFVGIKEYYLIVDSMSDGSYQLQSDKEKYSINSNSIRALQSDVDIEILMGPVLIINLALNNVFCLHASSFILNDKAFIFMGDSGTGKSTVAKFIGEKDSCLRISDDILPLKISENQLTLLPCFPQLKLPKNQQYQGDDIVKETILLFAKQSKDGTSIEPMDRFSANKKIIQHSVATKLFARNELQSHLSFCHKTCSLARSYQVNYQHSSNSLDQLFTLLNEIN